jgi:hypothetical protein
MLTTAKAIERAARPQRAAILDAAAHAAVLGESVGFLCRAVAGGTRFEAVALDSARTCAVIDEDGKLELVAGERTGDGFRRPRPTGRFRADVQRAAERALVAAARPRDVEAGRLRR